LGTDHSKARGIPKRNFLEIACQAGATHLSRIFCIMRNALQTFRQKECTLRLLAFSSKENDREGFATEADLNAPVFPKFLPKRKREPELLESPRKCGFPKKLARFHNLQGD
jgi:hypothetical protein